MTPKVIVDASVLVASLMADGRARHVLLHSPSALYVPPRVFDELGAKIAEIAKRARVGRGIIEALLQDVRRRTEEVPEALLAPFRIEATARAKAADAMGDEEYVAAAMALDAPIWTYDHDFARVKGIRTVGTAEVAGDVSTREER